VEAVRAAAPYWIAATLARSGRLGEFEPEFDRLDVDAINATRDHVLAQVDVTIEHLCQPA
jgi:hypothetical protein